MLSRAIIASFTGGLKDVVLSRLPVTRIFVARQSPAGMAGVGRAGKGLVMAGLVVAGISVGTLGALPVSASPTLDGALRAQPVAASVDAERVSAFLTVTGFDAAIESLGQSAAMAPTLLGRDADAFGADWIRLVDQVFDPASMLEDASAMLAATLDEAMLDHAAEFYASDLGRALVTAENAAHRTAEEVKRDGAAAALQAASPARVALLRRMMAALDSSGSGVRALEEIQIRFLDAADAAGVIDLPMDMDALRALMAEGRSQLAEQLDQSMLESAAWTYAEFSDSALEAYASALEAPLMRQVYDLMTAVQFEIMVSRFETLAVEMARLRPGRDL